MKGNTLLPKFPIRDDFYKLNLFYRKRAADLVLMNHTMPEAIGFPFTRGASKDGDSSGPLVALYGDITSRFKQGGEVSDWNAELNDVANAYEDSDVDLNSDALPKALHLHLNPAQNLDMASDA